MFVSFILVFFAGRKCSFCSFWCGENIKNTNFAFFWYDRMIANLTVEWRKCSTPWNKQNKRVVSGSTSRKCVHFAIFWAVSYRNLTVNYGRKCVIKSYSGLVAVCSDTVRFVISLVVWYRNITRHQRKRVPNTSLYLLSAESGRRCQFCPFNIGINSA